MPSILDGLEGLHSPGEHLLPKRLRKLRDARGMKQRDLAKLLGVSQATISNVERGERRLDVIELHQWLHALGGNFLDFVAELDNDLRRGALSGPNADLKTRPPGQGRNGSMKRSTLLIISDLSELVQRATGSVGVPRAPRKR